MSFLGRLFRPVETRNLSLTNYAQWVELGLVGQSQAGVNVTPTTALKYSVVYACVRVLAETIASLPLILYERQERGKRRAPEFYLYELLHSQPNPMMTAYDFFLTLQGHLALWGNAYAEIEYNGRGQVAALWPLRPDRMLEITTDSKGRRLYKYQLPQGQVQELAGDVVWHMRGMGIDGFNGHNQVDLMRQSIGLGMAAEEFGARFFGNDARPGGILKHPGVLGDEAHERLRTSWEAAHGGLNRSHRVAILEEGLDYKEIGVPPNAAQFLETRAFQVRDVARYYRVPLHMINDLERATFSNIEQQSIEFVVYTMRPWLVNWEQSIRSNLMLKQEKKKYFAQFLVEGLLRGDTLSRYQAYNSAWMSGWLSQNDIRDLENMNPIEGGDQYYVPLNMVPTGGNQLESPASRTLPVGSSEGRGGEEELRAKDRNVIAMRLRLRNAYRPLIRDAAGRVFRREANDVGNAAKKFAKNNDRTGFQTWLDEFYREHESFSARQMEPVFQAYGEVLGPDAAAEVGAEADPDEVTRYTRRYSDAWAARNATRSRDQIDAAMEETEATLAELDELFDGWRNERPEDAGNEESVRFGEALSKFVYLMAGVTVVRWWASGKSCPYCQSLNGRVIGIQENFLNEGEDYQPSGAGSPLKPHSNIGHPPAHNGCDCVALAG